MLVVELVVGQVVRQPDASPGLRGEDLGDQASAGEIGRAVGDVQVDLDHPVDPPATGSGDALAVGFAVALVRQLVVAAEHRRGLIDLGREDRFLQRHHVGYQGREAIPKNG